MSRATEREREREQRGLANRRANPGRKPINKLTHSLRRETYYCSLPTLAMRLYIQPTWKPPLRTPTRPAYSHFVTVRRARFPLESPHPPCEKERERDGGGIGDDVPVHTRSKTTRERERESWLSARSKESGNGSSSILNSSSRFLYILENFLLLLIIYCEIYFILLIFEEIENFLLLLLLIIYL